MKAKKITLSSLLVALDIVLSRMLGTYVYNFKFVPNSVAGLSFNPLWAGFICATADILGVLINSGGYAIHLGFTFSAFLRGVIYSLFFYKKEPSFLRAICASFATTILIDVLLDSYWLTHLIGKNYILILTGKLLTRFGYALVMAVVMHLVLPRLKTQILKYTK